MSDFIKAEKVVRTALGLLLREITLPAYVWRDAVGDFTGAKNDTISIRLPAFAPARTRSLRSGTPLTIDELFERKVDVTLDKDVYKRVNIDDETLTLDIEDFGVQVLNPIMVGVGEGLEQQLADEVTGATYENTISFVESTDDPYSDVAVAARKFLNGASVPFAGRVIAAGSAMESAFLNSDRFIKANESGSTQTLREAVIGRVAGFDVISCPVLPADEAYAFHRTAYVMSQRAPVIPAGAPWGASESFQGFALRFARVFDPNYVRDQLVANAYVGTNVVTDFGHYDDDPATGGKFVPGENPDDPITGHTDDWLNDDDRLVRAVKITVS
jgi:hypothetical protein